MIDLHTLLGYLVGRRDAILRVATHPRGLLLGGVFVLIAGFAREYDGESLWHEPWHLLLPFGGSLLISTLVHGVLRLLSGPTHAEDKGPPVGFWTHYPTTLRLFWWTAPMALLYAIPFEMFLGAGAATQANLLILALVSLWRVTLISRALSVTWGTPFTAVVTPVLAVASGIVFLVLVNVSFPLVAIMGGIRLTESEAVLSSFSGNALLICLVTGPVWFFHALVVARRHLVRDRMLRVSPRTVPGASSPHVSRPLAWTTVAALAVWVPLLLVTQPLQQNRWHVEDALREGRLADAVAHVRGQSRDAFPPHWDPPPRAFFGQHRPRPLDVAAAAAQGHAPRWFLSNYLEKLDADRSPGSLAERIARDDDDRALAHRMLQGLAAHPDRPQLLAVHARVLVPLVGALREGPEPLPAPLQAWFDARPRERDP